MANKMGRQGSSYGELYSAFVDSMREDDKPDPVNLLRDDPTLVFGPLNIVPDPWQVEALTSRAKNLMLLASRQAGKSQTLAGLALNEALTYPWAEVLIISRTLRQSSELMLKVKELWRGITGGRVHRRRFTAKTLKPETAHLEEVAKAKGWDGAALLGDDYVSETQSLKLQHKLPNWSRITSLPGNPDNIVSFSAVTLLIIDEGSRVPDQLMSVVRPFLAATEEVHGRPGRLVVASTPFGKRGWFWEAWDRTSRTKDAYARGQADRAAGLTHCPWSDRDAERRVERKAWYDAVEGNPIDVAWQTIRVTAPECHRIKADFLEDERAQIGERWYRQEYMCSFEDLVDAVFSHADIMGMVDSSIKPRRLWCD